MSEVVNEMSDPFDDVVEVESTGSMSESGSEGTDDPFDDVVEIEAKGEDSEDKTDEIPEDEEESKKDSDGSKDIEAKSKESEDESIEEISVDSINKQIEEGSLEVQIGDEVATLKDLKNSYIGQKEISKRFTEYDVKSKQLTSDTNEINGYIDEFSARMKNGDSVGAMQYFGEFAGVAPYMIKEQLIAALTPEVIRRSEMTEMELQNESLYSQNEYLTQQRESDLARRDSDQAAQEVINSTNSHRETNGIDEQTWNDTSSYLEKNLPEGAELTPELVVSTIKYSNMYSQAEEVISLSGENLENKEQWLEELVSV